jgi:septal ring factor EnvC (AmiA/AmiB activator)
MGGTATKKTGAKKPIQRNVAANRKKEAAAKRAAEKAKEEATVETPKAGTQAPPGQPAAPPIPDVTIEVKTLAGAEGIKTRIENGKKAIAAAAQKAQTAEANAQTANANLNAARTVVAGEQKSLLSTVGVVAEMSGKLDMSKSYTTVPSEDGQLILCYEKK